MKTLKLKILFLFGFFQILNLNAQEVVLKGKVTDARTNEALIGVNVILEGSKSGTITDMNGEFNLSISKDAKNLIFTYIGYTKQVQKITEGKYLTIKLQEENTSLNEVVVVGYGTQKKATITGAIDNINSEKLNMSFSSNMQNQLTGKLAGVRVIQKTGEPGKFNSDINIRGMGTPLIIIDGVASTMDMFNRLAPSEIDNISVLKDASAAVYGMKAGNGVLLITTRKGGSGDGKPHIEYQGNLGFSSMVNLNAPMNAYDFAIMQNEILKYKLDPQAPLYDAARLETIKNTPGMNVYDAIMRSSNPIENHTVNVSGNVGEKFPVKYFLFGNYMKEYGLLRSGDLSYDRYNLRSNITAALGNGLSVDVNISYVSDKKEEPYNDVNQLWKSIWGVKPVDDDGNVLTSLYANNDGEHYLKIGQTGYNPLPFSQIDDVGYMRNSTANFRGQLSVNWDVPYLKGLKAKYLFTYENNNYAYKDNRKAITFYSQGTLVPTVYNSPTNVKQEFKGYTKNNMQASLNYERVFAKSHSLKMLALYEQSSYYNPGNISVIRNLNLDVLDEISAGSVEEQQIGSSYPSTLTNQGLIAKINYDYNGKYLLESGFRYDGSSQFATGKRWGFFPNVSAGWRLSEEKFMRENAFFSFVDNLKLRASYGILGDDSGASYEWANGYTYPLGKYIFNGTIINGLASKGIANTNLTWYTAKTANIGIDWTFWNGLFGGSTDVYQRHRDGLLANRASSIPTTVGATMPKENLNSDLTIGWDLLLSHTNKIGKFNYSVTANLNITRTKNLHVEGARKLNSYDNWRNNQNDRWNDMMWGHVLSGQITSAEQAELILLHQKTSQNALSGPGDYYHADLNGDGWITEWDDLTPSFLNNIPKITGGLTFTAGYDGFDLSMAFNGAAAYTVLYEEYLRTPQVFNGTVGALGLWTDRWRQDESGNWIAGKYPRYRAEWTYLPNVWDDSRRERNASYIRLKNMEIGYKLPKPALKLLKMQQARVYVNGYNLLTFSAIKEMDPEYRGAENGAAAQYMYPMNRNYSFGINVTF